MVLDNKCLEYNEFFAGLSPFEIRNLMFNVQGWVGIEGGK